MHSCTICKNQDSPKWYSGPTCKSCYQKTLYLKKSNDLKQKSTQFKFKNPQYNKQWYLENRDHKLSKEKEYRYLNKEKRKIINKAWATLNKNKCKLYCANRRAAKLRATPPWLSEEQKNQIKRIYLNCPKDMQVDHIVPLRVKMSVAYMYHGIYNI